jgi:hypothetical protein
MISPEHILSFLNVWSEPMPELPFCIARATGEQQVNANRSAPLKMGKGEMQIFCGRIIIMINHKNQTTTQRTFNPVGLSLVYRTVVQKKRK